MRDAFGGEFMIRLFLVFIIIYMFFTAIAINYAKAFKVKNKVIDYLEDHEIVNINANANQFTAMEEYFETELLGGMNYHVDVPDCGNDVGGANGSKVEYCQHGIKITKYCPNGRTYNEESNDGIIEANTEGVYYRVETYFGWNLGFLKVLTKLGGNSSSENNTTGFWRISGETRVINNELK